MSASGRGHGKIILVGEHAAVYGYPALAGSLARGVWLTAIPVSGDERRLRIPGWSLDVRSDDDHPVARATAAVAAALGIEGGFRLDGDSDLAPSAGLGSSAALAVAMTRALARLIGRELDQGGIAAVADHAERCFHGNPSGVDVAIATRGGFGQFRRGSGFAPVSAAPLGVVIGLSGQPRSTAAMVERVAAARAARPAHVDAELAALGAAADTATAQVRAADRDLHQLGAILTAAHHRLAALGVSNPVLDELVAAALAAGATGAKLTGAGGGGAVLALAAGREDAVLAAWRALGKDGFATTIGEVTPA